jgi:uncharacterized alkaline shock family protein YloU
MKELARTPLGGIAVDPKALERLVRDAAASVDGARVVRASLEVAEDSAAALTITALRGAVLPELAALVQQRVAEVLEQALGTPPERVDVTIEAVHSEVDQ